MCEICVRARRWNVLARTSFITLNVFCKYWFMQIWNQYYWQQTSSMVITSKPADAKLTLTRAVVSPRQRRLKSEGTNGYWECILSGICISWVLDAISGYFTNHYVRKDSHCNATNVPSRRFFAAATRRYLARTTFMNQVSIPSFDHAFKYHL